MRVGDDVVLFDFWGVIGVVQSPQSVAGMASRLGVSVPAFSHAYWEFREAHDAGGSASVFWGQVADELSVDLDEVLLADLVRLDVASWSGVDKEMLEVLADLSRAGCRMALLSNAPRDLVDHASRVLAGLVPQLLFSCELGVAKPQPQAFGVALERLGVPAEQVVFVDDNAMNVRAAQACGMRAFQHVSVADTRSRLRALLGVPLG